MPALLRFQTLHAQLRGRLCGAAPFLVLAPALVGACEDFASIRPQTATAAATAEAPPVIPSSPAALPDDQGDEEDDEAPGTTWGPGLTLVSGGAAPRLLLEQRDKRPLRHGALEAVAGGGYAVEAAVPEADLPEHARVLSARSLTVITDRGERCETTVQDFAYRVDIIPDSHELDEWAASDRDPRAATATPDAPPQAVWQSAYGHWVTARLAPTEGSACAGTPLFAVPAGVDGLRVATPDSPPPAEAVAKAFRALPEYAAIQREYARYIEAEGLQDELAPVWELSDREPVVEAFTLAGQRYVSVSVPFAGCSPWDPGLWAVFHWPTEAGGQPQAIVVSTVQAPQSVRAIVRVGSEPLDFLVQEDFTEGVTVLRGERRLASWAREFHGCGC